MRCLACGAEMSLVKVIRDDTMMVPGYEDQTLECPSCHQVEQRRIFRSESVAPAEPAPTESVPVETSIDRSFVDRISADRTCTAATFDQRILAGRYGAAHVGAA